VGTPASASKRSWPMPTYWEPCPGNKNAMRDMFTSKGGSELYSDTILQR
jgi:hypothetical protein